MALTFLVLNDIMSNKDRERRRILLMNDTRLKKFLNFEPKYLRYYGRSNEPYYDPRNFVVRKANFFPNLGQHLTVLLHLWDMRALYHYIECYSFAYVYSGELFPPEFCKKIQKITGKSLILRLSWLNSLFLPRIFTMLLTVCSLSAAPSTNILPIQCPKVTIIISL